MKSSLTWLAGSIFAIAFAAFASAQSNLDLKTSIDVSAAAPRDVFESISKKLGCKLEIDSDIKQPVTMRLENVTMRTALTALSETLGRHWIIEGNVLHVGPAITATSGPSTGVQTIVGGVKGGVPAGISGGVRNGIAGGVDGGVSWNSDFMQRMERKTPADFRFDNAPLSAIMNELGKIAGIDMGVGKPDGDRQMTVDLSNSTVFAALQAIWHKANEERDASAKPLVFSFARRGSTQKMLLIPKPSNKSK